VCGLDSWQFQHFFMFNTQSKSIKRGAILSGLGFAFAVVMVMLQK